MMNQVFSMGSSSVFQAEVSAILTAAKILWQNEVQDAEIDFMVDSQAGLKSLKNPLISSRLVKETKEKLNQLGSINDVTLHWIEAHKGHKFNEMADKFANKGNASNRLGGFTCPNKRGIFSIIEAKAREEWTLKWDEEPGCRQSRFFIQVPSKTRSKELHRVSDIRSTVLSW